MPPAPPPRIAGPPLPPPGSSTQSIPHARMAMPRVFTKEDVRHAEKFALELATSIKGRVAAVVLDRTPVRPTVDTAKSLQIPVLVLLDDLTKPLSDQDVHGYLAIVSRLVRQVSKDLHVSTLKLSEHWQWCTLSVPHHIETIRYGVALYDRGFFEPMRFLVTKGRIRPTLESQGVYITRADGTIKNANHHLLQATLDLYWAGIDACHAALMKHGQIPPEPADVASTMDSVLVSRKLLEPEYPKIMRVLYELSRGILHKTIPSVSGHDYEQYYAQTSKLVKRMERLVGLY